MIHPSISNQVDRNQVQGGANNSKYENDSRVLRLGMIGGGINSAIGNVHRAAAQLGGRYRVVAGALSSNPDRACMQAEQLNIPRAYSDGETLLHDEAAREDGADVIAILTPNNSHFALAKLALELGFHVVCEKPLVVGSRMFN